MSTNPLNDIAPYPTGDNVTAENLALYETVGAYAYDVHVSELSKEAFSSESGSEVARRYHDALVTFTARFAVAFLLRKIREVVPDQADEIAEHLHGLWMDGGSMPEFLWDWLVEDGIDPRVVKRAVIERLEAA